MLCLYWSLACLNIFGLFKKSDGFFMGTKHTTPVSKFPMHNDAGKTYAKVGNDYIEYNDDEMYYDKHDRTKSSKELAKEDKELIAADSPMSISNSKTRKEEQHQAQEAWRQVKREDVDDVTGDPMYLAETYQSPDFNTGKPRAYYKDYGVMDYGKPPENLNGKPFGQGLRDYENQMQQPGYNHMDQGRAQNQFANNENHRKIFMNPFDAIANQYNQYNQYDQMGNDMNNPDVRRADEDYANYLRNPPRGFYTIRPLSDEQTTKIHTTTVYTSMYNPANFEIPPIDGPVQDNMMKNEIPPMDKPVQHDMMKNEIPPVDEPVPHGMMKNISVDDFIKYHGEHGDQNNAFYAEKRRVVELNERRAAEAIRLHNEHFNPAFDCWNPEDVTTHTTRRTSPTTTTEFVPRADQTIPDFIVNF